MGTSLFWAWSIWFLFAIVFVPGIVIAIRYEWDDLKKSQHHRPSINRHQHVPDHRKAA